jgi:hypothetical protein
VVIPHFGGTHSPYLAYYDTLGVGPAGLARSLFEQPQTVLATLINQRSIHYLRDLLTPVGFLSLLNPLTLTFSAPDLAINLLSSHEPMHFVEKYHYTAPLLPGIMISAILGTAWLARWLSGLFRRGYRLIVWLIAAGILGISLYYRIFSICRGDPLRSPAWAGARPCPYPGLLRRYVLPLLPRLFAVGACLCRV